MDRLPVITMLTAVSPSVTGQINDRIETAMLFGIIASAAAITSVTLFFVFHIPRCIDALTGLGRKRELSRLKKKNRHTAHGNTGFADPRNAARKCIISSDDSYRDRPLPEGFIIELELPIK